MIHLLACHAHCAEKFCIDHLPGIHPRDHLRIQIHTPKTNTHTGLMFKKGDSVIFLNNFDHVQAGVSHKQSQEFWRDASVISTKLTQYGKTEVKVL